MFIFQLLRIKPLLHPCHYGLPCTCEERVCEDCGRVADTVNCRCGICTRSIMWTTNPQGVD